TSATVSRKATAACWSVQPQVRRRTDVLLAPKTEPCRGEQEPGRCQCDAATHQGFEPVHRVRLTFEDAGGRLGAVGSTAPPVPRLWVRVLATQRGSRTTNV